jgi:hypothetical protein
MVSTVSAKRSSTCTTRGAEPAPVLSSSWYTWTSLGCFQRHAVPYRLMISGSASANRTSSTVLICPPVRGTIAVTTHPYVSTASRSGGGISTTPR